MEMRQDGLISKTQYQEEGDLERFDELDRCCTSDPTFPLDCGPSILDSTRELNIWDLPSASSFTATALKSTLTRGFETHSQRVAIPA